MGPRLLGIAKFITEYSAPLWVLFAVLLLLLTGQACWAALFNQAPFISEFSAAQKLAAPSEKVPLKCIAVDRDRDTLKYEWSSDGGTIDGKGPFVVWKAPEKPGSYTITAKVSDGKGGKAASQVFVNVLSKSNNPPLIEDLSARPQLIFKGQSTTLICDAMDPDGDSLIYHWEAKSGRLAGEGAKVIWHAPLEERDFVISCYVTDSKGNKSRPAAVTVKAICDCEGTGKPGE